MNRKTEFTTYNEDDFVQRGDSLDELTVTITLCEYRNLIKELAQSDMTIEWLREEKAELEKKLEAAAKALSSFTPELMRDIGNILTHWGDTGSTQADKNA